MIIPDAYNGLLLRCSLQSSTLTTVALGSSILIVLTCSGINPERQPLGTPLWPCIAWAVMKNFLIIKLWTSFPKDIKLSEVSFYAFWSSIPVSSEVLIILLRCIRYNAIFLEVYIWTFLIMDVSVENKLCFRLWEAAWWLRACLLCRFEDWSSDPQSPDKFWVGMVACLSSQA